MSESHSDRSNLLCLTVVDRGELAVLRESVDRLVGVLESGERTDEQQQALDEVRWMLAMCDQLSHSKG